MSDCGTKRPAEGIAEPAAKRHEACEAGNELQRLRDENAALRERLAALETRRTDSDAAARAAAAPDALAQHCERTLLFFGKDAFDKIRRSFVVVIGVGGVGSMAATALVRSGVRKIRIVDFDIVTMGSLNRNAVATREDVGKPKVQCLAEHFAKICPEVEVEMVEAFFKEELAQDVIARGSPDIVIDCIDNVPTKVQLLAFCVQSGIKVISSFGVGACIDPSKIRAADIKDTYACPLGRVIRKRLAKINVRTGITCVFSAETNRRQLAELSQEQHDELKASGQRSLVRTRAIPSFMCVPAVAGLTLADVALCVAGGLPHDFNGESEACPPGKFDAQEGDPTTIGKAKRALADFCAREARRNQTASSEIKSAITPESVQSLIRDVWELKSALTERDMVGSRPALVRFVQGAKGPVTLKDVIIVRQDEVDAWENQTMILDDKAHERVQKTLSSL